MRLSDELIEQVLEVLSKRRIRRIAILGLSSTAMSVRAALSTTGFAPLLLGIFDPDHPQGVDGVAGVWDTLFEKSPDLIVVADDERKERLLTEIKALEPVKGEFPHVVLGGTGHLEFADPIFQQLDEPSLVPSYATGYPYTRVHMFQCLKAAAANGLQGTIVEFGAFKGGTTAWLARTALAFGLSSRVIAFDSWRGFPPRRSVLDLYAHPRCVFSRIDEVRKYLEPLGVELVQGDIALTAGPRLADEQILLAFVDTDNYSPAHAAVRAVLPNLIRGGSIVFDHYATTRDFIYTVGERLAAKELLSESGLLQIHGTGVFVKI